MTSENPPSQDGFSVFREASLPLADAFGLFRGGLITFLGLLYYGVYFGGMPLNQSGRLGLLLILTSLILLWEGSFLGRQYRRSSWLMTIGIVFVGMGIVSCIVPGILTDVIRPLLGLQNIITGVLFLALERVVPAVHGTRSPPAEPVTLPPLMKRLGHGRTVLNIVLIAFGLDALAPVLLPSLLGIFGYQLFFPVLIITVGLLNLYMTYLNQKLQ